MTKGGFIDICKHTKWLCENTRRLEKFAGRWVAFLTEENHVRSGNSLKQALQSSGAKRNQPVPFVFHVPSKAALRNPFPIATQK
jgi:hypothetical protein